MRVQVGDRVLAVSHADETTLYIYGEGEYEGYQQVPQGTKGALNPTGERIYHPDHTNARIKLDSGEYVWGMQCWFGKVDSLTIQGWLTKYADNIVTIPVPTPYSAPSTQDTTVST